MSVTPSAAEHHDSSVHRHLTGQLSEDLSWLEAHCRRQSDLGRQANQLRYAGALVRNLIGPFLNDQPADPLHVAVVGGAGAGKSTVANFLAGTLLAESNPQAGFTRHPIAYVAAGPASGPALNWPAHVGFLGPLKRLGEPTPASLDADVYQVRRVPLAADAHTVLGKWVVWDCPDMTTWAATGYIPRLVEVAALADLIVYVASDERYNDEVPTQWLHMLVHSGKSVIVCLTKMREADAPAFVDHFRAEVLGRMHAEHVPCLTIPHLTADELADPIRNARRHQIPLLNQVAVIGEPPATARRRSVRAATAHLTRHQADFLGVARSDLDSLQAWRRMVLEGQADFDDRYRREYLTTKRFHRFDEALVRLLELLELPGVGKIVSGALYVVRTPYRLLKGLFARAMQRPATPSAPEKPVLEEAMQGWLNRLRKEAVARAPTHHLWRHIQKGFDAGLAEQAVSKFEQGYRDFQLSQADEIDRTARAIYEDLEKNPVALNTLRGSKFALEVGAIAGTVVAGGINWVDLILAPLAASVTHQLVELMGKQYVDAQREQARLRQQVLVNQQISAPLAAWLTEWPATGGSDYERLQAVLRRIPAGIQQVESAVQRKLG